MTALRYVYGIIPAPAAATVDEAAITGIDGTPVRTIADGPFAAVSSELDGDEYGESHINDRVRDLDWLTPRAAAHQDVNARVLDLVGVVLPLSFGALYRDLAGVREMLGEDAAARKARLDELAGRAEWVVTVLRDAGTVPPDADEVRELEREIAGSTPGRGFLLEKRRTAVASAAAERADRDAADLAQTLLQDVTERSYREPVAKGGADVVVLRLSLLAPRRRAADVDGAIASLGTRLDRSGYRVRASGPWPAYRFGSLP
jgi:hypothetical protein